MSTWPPLGVPVAVEIPTPTFIAHPRPVVAGEIDLRGPGALSGTVRVANVPAARTVEVRDDVTMQLAARVVSASDGTWSAPGLTTARLLRVTWLKAPSTQERDVTYTQYAAVP